MENASKALIIAGGVLIAIMILSLLVISYNRISDTQRAKQSSMSEEQIAEFNKQYEAYNRSDVTGFELVSLINKIIDFNDNNADDSALNYKNSDKAYQRMDVAFTLTNTTDFRGKLFEATTYDSSSERQNRNSKNDQKTIEGKIFSMQQLEGKYTTTLLTSLIAMGDYENKYNKNDFDSINDSLNRTSDSTKLNKNNSPKPDDVNKYEEYVKFKRAKFTCNGTDYNKNTGRIISLSFQQTK